MAIIQADVLHLINIDVIVSTIERFRFDFYYHYRYLIPIFKESDLSIGQNKLICVKDG